MPDNSMTVLADLIGPNLPYLRRYSRALTGSQSTGDKYAVTTLEAILTDPNDFKIDQNPKIALFRMFHSIWSSSGAHFTANEDGLAAHAQKHLSRLTINTREALLLTTLEEFTPAEAANILNRDVTETRSLITLAYAEMAEGISGKVMIIEDEAIIAADLQAIVSEMRHQTTGVARTKTAAEKLFRQERPNLILSDIQLADDSSGIDAVNEILKTNTDIPVIFITAFPERLLTGEGPEPAFLISKPYTEDQVRSAISQAMFFSSTETLHT